MDLKKINEYLKWIDVSHKDECWNWKGKTFRGGSGGSQYGQFHIGAEKAAHRIIWKLVNGPIPKGLCICHRCDNGICCNPNHLFLGTIKDNTHDAITKGRMYQNMPGFRAGTAAPNSRLTERDVRYIRSMRKKITQRELGIKFNICASGVGRIQRREKWRHVI